jgi:chondroitin sulfate proteoglycan 4
LQNKRENKWTTFLKARLNCSVPGDYPFYFDEIQSAFYVNDNENEDNGVVYAVFTTPENSIAGSAICSFNLTSIERTFKGPFKTRENGDPTKTWRPDNSVLPNDRSGFECERPSTSPNEVDSIDSRKYQLMDETVESTTFGPLYHVSNFYKYSIKLVVT